MGALYFHL